MSDPAAPSAWSDALLVARLFALDPSGSKGVLLRASPGPVRDRWMAALRAMLPASMPFRRVPTHVTEGRLLGGLDLAATLRAGRPIAERGLLAEADGGVLVLAMAERTAPLTAAFLAAALDDGAIALERDGIARRVATCLGVIALDEGLEEDERAPPGLADRLAFHLDLTGIEPAAAEPVRDDLVAARACLDGLPACDDILEALCHGAAALGIDSVRAPILAVHAARLHAALAGRTTLSDADAAVAARLVLAPRATRLPVPPPQPPEDAAAPEDPPPPQDNAEEETGSPDSLGDLVLAAARAAIPAGLLAALSAGQAARRRRGMPGGAGHAKASLRRGRPVGTRIGDPRSGARLNLIETLRAAAPWQGLRRGAGGAGRVAVRREDFRVTRFRQRMATTTIFAVDASGSAALHRLAEAKGAVELLLADCYVRRDQVALLSFRGRGAELLLPPTRSLARAKRGLAELAGGGGTPLAAGIDAAGALADAVRRKGQTPVVIFLTDGRANLSRDGSPGRERAGAEALAAAQSLRLAGLATLLIDTAPKPQPPAEALARAMGAAYLPLPQADAAALSRAVRAVAPQQSMTDAR